MFVDGMGRALPLDRLVELRDTLAASNVERPSALKARWVAKMNDAINDKLRAELAP